jgi:hypothetical protein
MGLAKPGDPYISANGKVFDGKGKELDVLPVADSLGPSAARAFVSSKRRSISDLSTDPKTQTAIAVVLFYSIFGLSDNEIAYTVGITHDDITRLKKLDAYQETFELLFWEMIHSNGQSLVAKIAAKAPGALDNLFNIADSAQNENARLKANQDILDRSGLHPETLFGKAGGDNIDGLKIVVKKADDESTTVDINLRR